jgi:hypothetical protein
MAGAESGTPSNNSISNLKLGHHLAITLLHPVVRVQIFNLGKGREKKGGEEGSNFGQKVAEIQRVIYQE